MDTHTSHSEMEMCLYTVIILCIGTLLHCDVCSRIVTFGIVHLSRATHCSGVIMTKSRNKQGCVTSM